jgi:hypothetical protein
MNDLLKQCSLNENNFGSCVGGMDWITTDSAGKNISYNPTNESNYANY